MKQKEPARKGVDLARAWQLLSWSVKSQNIRPWERVAAEKLKQDVRDCYSWTDDQALL